MPVAMSHGRGALLSRTPRPIPKSDPAPSPPRTLTPTRHWGTGGPNRLSGVGLEVGGAGRAGAAGGPLAAEGAPMP